MPGHPFPGDWIGGGSTKQVRANRLNVHRRIICTALSLVAAYLTLVLFYGTLLMVFHYAFGVELWNPFQGGGAGMGGSSITADPRWP